MRETDHDDRLAALSGLAQIYQLAGGVLTQLRHTDLAASALDDAIRLADSAVVSQCWVLLRQARLDEAEQLAVATADLIEPSFPHRHPHPPGHLELAGTTGTEEPPPINTNHIS